MKQQWMNYVVYHFPMLQSFIVTAETHSQGTRRETSSEHGSALRILPLIISLRARPTTMELQGGLCGVGHSKIGRKPDPYCGSVAIVRFSTLNLSLLLIESLAGEGGETYDCHGPTVWVQIRRAHLWTPVI